MNVKDIRLSFSALKAFSNSPAHFAYYKQRKFKANAAMQRGSLTHLLALEPHKQNEYKVVDCATRAAKAFKEAVIEQTEKHGEKAGEKVCTSKEFLEATNLAEAIHANPLASKLIREAVQVEKHLEWGLDGVAFHGYADVVGKDYIADLKITDSKPSKVQRMVLDNLNHMQLALYSLAEFNLHSEVTHYIIACDPKPPYGVVVYELTAELIDDGIKRAKVEVSMFKDWYRGWDGDTPPKSYDAHEPLDCPMILDLPHWYK
jgi:hypothetical protein